MVALGVRSGAPNQEIKKETSTTKLLITSRSRAAW